MDGKEVDGATANIIPQDAIKAGKIGPSGVFFDETPMEAFASVEGSLSHIMGKAAKKQALGMPTLNDVFADAKVGKSYEEHLTQEAIDKTAAAFNDLHQVIGKASPSKPPKPGSAMALLSKKHPPSN